MAIPLENTKNRKFYAFPAYAVEPVTMTVVASLAVAYFGACGLTFITQNMDKDALVSSVQRLLQEFLDTELGGISIQDWLGTVWDVAVLNTKILMGRPLTNELMGFAQWVAQKYAAQEGENIVYEGRDAYPNIISVRTYFSVNYPYSVNVLKSEVIGSSYVLPLYLSEAGDFVIFQRYNFKNMEKGNYFYFSTCVLYGLTPVRTESVEGGKFSYYSITDYNLSDGPFLLDISLSWAGDMPFSLSPGDSFPISLDGCYIAYTNSVDQSLSVDRKENVVYIPEGIEADQGIALDVGASPTMDLSQILQQVLEDVLAGTLTSSMEIADAEDVPVDPPAGEITDVDGLGLPALGAALTTRFPFSIPWDISRAVQLLAAPAKTPYFEVDFFEPISDLVGGWKGSTKIVLDFSEFEIIGQVSRWTSTIGFCLMLAGSTKRLIWTA